MRAALERNPCGRILAQSRTKKPKQWLIRARKERARSHPAQPYYPVGASERGRAAPAFVSWNSRWNSEIVPECRAGDIATKLAVRLPEETWLNVCLLDVCFVVLGFEFWMCSWREFWILSCRVWSWGCEVWGVFGWCCNWYWSGLVLVWCSFCGWFGRMKMWIVWLL